MWGFTVSPRSIFMMEGKFNPALTPLFTLGIISRQSWQRFGPGKLIYVCRVWIFNNLKNDEIKL